MICNGKLYSAWIATKSGINPAAIRKNGKIVFSFVDEDRMFELRREVQEMNDEDIRREVDPVVYSYLTDLMKIENKKIEAEENKRRIKALEEEVRRKNGDNLELPKITPSWKDEIQKIQKFINNWA